MSHSQSLQTTCLQIQPIIVAIGVITAVIVIVIALKQFQITSELNIQILFENQHRNSSGVEKWPKPSTSAQRQHANECCYIFIWRLGNEKHLQIFV